jgi:hypothetical protein
VIPQLPTQASPRAIVRSKWQTQRELFLSDLHCLSPVLVRVHPAIGRDFLLFGEPNDMHGRRVPSLLQDLHFSAASNFHIGVSRGRRIASSGKLARDFKPSKSRHLGVRKYRFGFGITSKRNLSVRAALRFAHAFVLRAHRKRPHGCGASQDEHQFSTVECHAIGLVLTAHPAVNLSLTPHHHNAFDGSDCLHGRAVSPP